MKTKNVCCQTSRTPIYPQNPCIFVKFWIVPKHVCSLDVVFPCRYGDVTFKQTQVSRRFYTVIRPFLNKKPQECQNPPISAEIRPKWRETAQSGHIGKLTGDSRCFVLVGSATLPSFPPLLLFCAEEWRRPTAVVGRCHSSAQNNERGGKKERGAKNGEL